MRKTAGTLLRLLGLLVFAFLVLVGIETSRALAVVDAVTTFPADLQFRRNEILASLNGRPSFAVNYRVNVLKPGAYVTNSITATTLTVRQGHGFAALDKFIVNTDRTKYRIVTSVSATSVSFSGSLTVTAGDILVNLGQDTGVTTPNFDNPGTSIYSEPSGTVGISQSLLLTNAQGMYSYWHASPELWEFVRDASAIPVAVIPLATTVPAIRFVNWDFSGIGAAKAPLWNFPFTNDGTSMERVTFGLEGGYPANADTRFQVIAQQGQSILRSKIPTTQGQGYGAIFASEFRGASVADANADGTVDPNGMGSHGMLVSSVHNWTNANSGTDTLFGTDGLNAQIDYYPSSTSSQSNNDVSAVIATSNVGTITDADGNGTAGTESFGRVRDVYGVQGISQIQGKTDIHGQYGGYFEARNNRVASVPTTVFRGTSYALWARYANGLSFSETVPSVVTARVAAPTMGSGGISRFTGLLVDDITGPASLRAAYFGGGVHIKSGSAVFFNGVQGSYPGDNTGDGLTSTYDATAGMFGLKFTSGTPSLDWTGANIGFGTAALGSAAVIFKNETTAPKITSAGGGNNALLLTNGSFSGGSCADTAGSSATLTATGCNVIRLTSGSTAITSIGPCGSANTGQLLTIICQGYTGTITDGAGTIRLSANLICTADDTLSLVCEGATGNWLEIGRSVN